MHKTGFTLSGYRILGEDREQMDKWTLDDMPSQEGRTAIVTGSNSGLGFSIAKGLASNGARVVMACRNMDKAKLAVKQIRSEFPEATIDSLKLDLSDLGSVKNFCDTFKANFTSLDLLVNNAGLMAIPYRLTADGFEMQFGVNHLGHFALTGHLLDMLESTPASRIIVMGSSAEKAGLLDLDDLLWKKRRYRSWGAYYRSKLANMLFMLELSDRLRTSGSQAEAMAAHPGYSDSNILVKNSEMTNRPWIAWGGRIANRLVSQSADMGALPALYAATAPGAANGEYYGPGGFLGMYGYPSLTKPGNKRISKDLQVQLWEKSEELTGISFL